VAAYRRVYDSRHLQAGCQVLGSAPEPHAGQSSMGYLFRVRQVRGQMYGGANVSHPVGPMTTSQRV